MHLGALATVVAWLAATPAPAAPPLTFAPAPPATPAPATPAPPAPDQAPAPPPPAPVSSPQLAPPTADTPLQPAPPPPPADADELPLSPPPRAPPLPALRQRRYGDTGSTELSLALGYTKQTGFFGGGGFRSFVIDGVGPGIEASIQKADGQPTMGLLLASLKLVPVRGEVAALILTGRAGRVFMSDHDDGWGVGGAAGAIFFLSPGVGLEVGYAILWLLPSRFCADLVSCRIEGPELGLRVSF